MRLLDRLRRRRRVDRARVLAWNCYAYNTPANVRAWLATWIDTYDPDVIELSEAARHHKTLKALAAEYGMTLFQETPDPDAERGDDTGDCATLLAADVDSRGDWVARMTRRWMVMSHRVRHEPHRYQVTRPRIAGRTWRFRGSHWPTGGKDGANAEAWAESARKSRRWLRTGAGVPSADVGDLNATADELREVYGPRFTVAGTGPDHAVTRNVAKVTMTELGKGGGDHHARVYDMTAKTALVRF